MNYEILKESPLFHFSLHSKELFHSNFLAWLGMDRELREVFKNVMESLGVSRDYIQSWGDDFEILREKYNFDILVKAPQSSSSDSCKGKVKNTSNDDGDYYLVIENKIKSIPTKKQLEEYSYKLKSVENRLNPEFLKILLSIDKFEGNLPTDWISASYSQIIEGLEKPLPKGLSEYKKDIIRDYARMLKGLVNILNIIKIDKNEPYLPDNATRQLRKELDELRIDDLYDKWRIAKIATLLTNEYGIKCNAGYSNKSPFLETEAYYFDENNKEGDYGRIQLQGNQFRRCICTNTDRSKLAETFKGFLYATRDEFQQKILEEHNTEKEKIFLGTGQRNNFCAYGEKTERPFWYQYVKISPDATIEQIAKCIKEDFSKLEGFRK